MLRESIISEFIIKAGKYHYLFIEGTGDKMDKYITTPITEEKTADLHAGDYVYITGTIYVARDAAHKRMMEVLERGEELPIDIVDSTIYYMGPSPAREGRIWVKRQ